MELWGKRMRYPAAGEDPNRLRVLIADDHALLRTGLRLIVERQLDMRVVAEASTIKTLLEYAEKAHPELIITDLAMPKIDITAIETLARRHPGVPILIMSMYDEPNLLRETLHAGARGYVLKSSNSETLITAIHAVVRGEIFVDPTLTHHLMKDFLPQKKHDPENLWEQLSDREHQVMKGIILGRTNREIADSLFLSVKTVETYRARAMEKLGLTNRSELITFALRHNLIQEATPKPETP
jgi:two-component system response regulator NreC